MRLGNITSVTLTLLTILLAVLLAFMVPLTGCTKDINRTVNGTWTTPVPPRPPGSTPVPTTVVPTTTSPFIPVPVTPVVTVTDVIPPVIPPTPVKADLVLIDEKILAFTWNSTAFSYTLKNPPLLIEYTLTVPNISRTRVVVDPITGGDRTVSISYPDPVAFFEVMVKDVETGSILARDGYGGQYDVGPSGKVWVRYPGTYYIEFTGHRVTADITFKVPGEQ